MISEGGSADYLNLLAQISTDNTGCLDAIHNLLRLVDNGLSSVTLRFVTIT